MAASGSAHVAGPMAERYADGLQGNPVFGIEGHGFDYIPESERNLSLRDFALFWIGTNAYVFFIFIGAITVAIGLSLWQALLAIVIGNLLFAYVAYGAIGGVRSGLPTMTFTRAAFGINGNRLNCFFAWLTSVAFEAINTILGVFAVVALLQKLGWENPGTAGKLVGLVVAFGLAAAIAVLGHATMIWVQRIFALFLLITVLVVFAYIVGDVDWGTGAASPLSTSATIGLVLLGITIIAAAPLSYMFNTSDWSRYLPGKTPGRSIFWTVMVFGGGTALLLCIVGAMAATMGDFSDPVAGMEPLVPGWLYIFYILAAIGGAVANNAPTFYASGLTLQAIGVPLKRYQATALDCTVATGIVLYILFVEEDFQTTLNDFLSFLLIWIGPFAGIWLVDNTLRRFRYSPTDIHNPVGGRYYGRGGFNLNGLAALVLGAIVCWLTINAPRYQGPLSDRLLADGDLTWLLGPLVGGAAYALLSWREIRRDDVAADQSLGRAITDPGVPNRQ
jgi:nucleobase:cation symporter-1, NCS1 family